jgi:hypothetical protein
LPIGGCEQSIFLGWRVQLLLFDARAQISRGAEFGKCASAWPFISRELTRFDAEDGRTCSARPLLPSIIEGPRSDVDAGSGNRSCGRLCGDRVVLVEQTAEAVTAPDAVRRRPLGRRRLRERRTLLERAMRTVVVVGR